MLCLLHVPHRSLLRLTLGYIVLSPLALSFPQDTSCSPIIVQKLEVAPHAACTHCRLSASVRLSKHAAEALQPYPGHPMHRNAGRPLAASGDLMTQDTRHALQLRNVMIWHLQATAPVRAIGEEKATHRRGLVNRHAALQGIHLLWGELVLLHGVSQPPVAAVACSGTLAV